MSNGGDILISLGGVALVIFVAGLSWHMISLVQQHMARRRVRAEAAEAAEDRDGVIAKLAGHEGLAEIEVQSAKDGSYKVAAKTRLSKDELGAAKEMADKGQAIELTAPGGAKLSVRPAAFSEAAIDAAAEAFVKKVREGGGPAPAAA